MHLTEGIYMPCNCKKVIALGFFDGVHLGHQALLRTAVQRAEELHMAPAVFTFDRSPREFVTGTRVPLLTTAEERRDILNICNYFILISAIR